MSDDIVKPPVGTLPRILWRFRLTWRTIFSVLLPIVLLPLIFIEDNDYIEEDNCEPGAEPRKSTKFRAAYAIIIVALYWMLEIMPLAVTSLLPIVLFPFLGIMGTAQISPAYFKETNAMFFGGLVLALAVEYCNLHRRIALKVMTVVGSSPVPLLLGVMTTSMFLSMWMSNTACCAMMLPILLAVLDTLSGANTSTGKEEPDASPITDSTLSVITTVTDSDSSLVHRSSSTDQLLEKKEKARWENIRKMYMFGVAYASNLGGTATITGTGPNLVFQSVIKTFDVSQNGKYLDMTFANWMALNVPATILNVALTYIYLVVVFSGWRNLPLISMLAKKKSQSKEELAAEEVEKTKLEGANKMLQTEYEKLGPMNFHEGGVLMVFVCVVLMWIFREPKYMKGWNGLFQDANETEGEIGDSSAAILGIVVMFLIPRDLSFFTGVPQKGQTYKTLLDWKFVQLNLSWGVVLLLGGGFALSDGATYSGLSQWIGDQLTGLEDLPKPAILIVVMILTAAVTEVCSNVATANIVLPILLTLSQKINIHPLYLTVPATISCSFAFMFPVATPPNALVFSAGNMKIMDMVKTGAFLNIGCIVIYFLVQISLGQLLFDYSGYEYSNSTAKLLLHSKSMEGVMF